jgi:hypothetical protein
MRPLLTSQIGTTVEKFCLSGERLTSLTTYK